MNPSLPITWFYVTGRKARFLLVTYNDVSGFRGSSNGDASQQCLPLSQKDRDNKHPALKKQVMCTQADL